MGELPLIRRGQYGKATLDHSACGRGYVVEFRPSAATLTVWGKARVFQTFQSFHAALAFWSAHVGVERPVHKPPGGRRRVKRPGGMPDFLPAHKVLVPESE